MDKLKSLLEAGWLVSLSEVDGRVHLALSRHVRTTGNWSTVIYIGTLDSVVARAWAGEHPDAGSPVEARDASR